MARLLSRGRGSFRRRIGHAGPQRHMGARPVVMRSPISKDGTQVRFGHRNEPVQTLSPNRADRALADGVGHGAAYRCLEDLEAEPFDLLIQVLREDAGPML